MNATVPTEKQVFKFMQEEQTRISQMQRVGSVGFSEGAIAVAFGLITADEVNNAVKTMGPRGLDRIPALLQIREVMEELKDRGKVHSTSHGNWALGRGWG